MNLPSPLAYLYSSPMNLPSSQTHPPLSPTTSLSLMNIFRVELTLVARMTVCCSIHPLMNPCFNLPFLYILTASLTSFVITRTHSLLTLWSQWHPMVLVLGTWEAPIAEFNVPITTVLLLLHKRMLSPKQSILSYGKAGLKNSHLSLIIISALLSVSSRN